jgi:hypothetical protein
MPSPCTDDASASQELMTYQLGSTLFVLATTGVLSLGQAWALRAGSGRALRHGLVWLAACLTMLAIASVMFDVQRAPPQSRRGAMESIFVLAGGLALLALAAGARWGTAAAKRAPDLRHAARALMGIHVVVVFLGGAVGMAVLVFSLLARAHW